MRIIVILAALASMLAGIVIGSSIPVVQQSGIPGAGLFAGMLGMVSLVATACPAAMGAAWVVDHFQRGRMRRSGCM